MSLIIKKSPLPASKPQERMLKSIATGQPFTGSIYSNDRPGHFWILLPDLLHGVRLLLRFDHLGSRILNYGAAFDDTLVRNYAEAEVMIVLHTGEGSKEAKND